MEAVSSRAPEIAQRSLDLDHIKALTRARRARSTTHRSRSVTGQCSVCLDLFTVDLYIDHHALCVSETSRIKWTPGHVERELVHRPDYCNGKVRLYGSLEGFFPEPEWTHAS